MDDLQGLENPTLAYNTAAIDDWGTNMPFLDIMKSSRGLLGHTDAQWGAYSTNELEDLGIMDADGWPTEIPAELKSVSTIWAWSNVGQPGVEDSRTGTYVLQYEGEGELRVSGGGINIISQGDGEIVFENTTGNTFQLDIFSTDPNGSGDYVRDISIVKEEYVELHEAGQIFNPGWTELVDDSRQFRFMDWMETNNSTLSEWEDRPIVGNPSWNDGVPLEVMVELANQLGVDPWFTIPHLATDEYITEFAEYVRDNLDPNLVATVEYSNEAWNWGFQQTHDLLAMAKEEFPDTHAGNVNSYYGYKATQMALIWKDVYGDEAEDRLVTALGVQTANDYTANSIFEAPTWEAADPENYVRPLDVFDAITGTTYFGSATLSNSSYRNELLENIQDPDVDAYEWLKDKLMNDADYAGSLPNLATNLSRLQGVAEEEDIAFIAYEGGQHVHHSFLVTGDLGQLQDFMYDFVRSPQMAELYEELWNMWEEYGSGPFMQFGDVAPSGSSGSWSLRTGLDDTTPRAEILDELNETTTAWWENRGGEHFQQGVIDLGTDAADTFDGTSQEDFLIGSGGNDTLRGYGEDDGLHGGDGDDTLDGGAGSDTLVGGEGSDIAVFAGAQSGYRITKDGAAISVLDLANGDVDTLTGIELLRFDDGDVAGTGTFDPTPVDPDPVDPDPVDPDPVDPDPVDPDPVDPDPVDPDPVDPDDVFNADTVAFGIGVNVQSLNFYGTTAKELNATDGVALSITGDSSGAAYHVVEKGHENTLLADDDATVSTSNYYIANEHGVDTALANGDLVINVGKVVGTAFADNITGRSHDDVFAGGDGNDYLNGRGGDDTLEGGAGSDHLIGGDGDDVAIFAGDQAGYAVTQSGDVTLVDHIETGDTDRLEGVERLRFADVEVDAVTGATTGAGTGVSSDAQAAADAQADAEVDTGTGEAGFKARYVDVPANVSALSQIDFDATAVHEEIVQTVQYSAGYEAFYDGGAVDNFAVSFTGALSVKTAGEYTFWLTSDDGSTLTIGDSTLGNDGLHAARTQSFTLDLDAGDVDLELLYFEAGGRAVVELDWAGPDTGGTRSALTGDAVHQDPGATPTDAQADTDPQEVPDDADFSVFLIDADTEAVLSQLMDGQELATEFGQYENATLAVFSDNEELDSVLISLDGIAERVENIEPYALFGDKGEGDFLGGAQLGSGDFNLSISGYSENLASGDLLFMNDFTFTIA